MSCVIEEVENGWGVGNMGAEALMPTSRRGKGVKLRDLNFELRPSCLKLDLSKDFMLYKMCMRKIKTAIFS